MVFSLQNARDQPVNVATDAGGDLSFDIPISLTHTPGGLRPGGGFVRADDRGRFVYVASGQQAGDAAAGGGRRAKIYLNDLSGEVALAGAASGQALEARIAGRANDGGAACASVPLLQPWTPRLRS